MFLLYNTILLKNFQAMDACIEFGWPTMRVEPLDVSQKEQLITDYLEGIYGKTLDAEQKKLIVDAEQTNNPLYLKSLLDEVYLNASYR